MDSKKLAAEKAVEYVKEGMVVGLGTGSTVFWAIQKIAARIKEGLNIRAVASSLYSEDLARQLNIPLVSFADVEEIDLYIDGADEVDKDFNLIKGGGGALLREKILAYNSREFIVIVDESKIVNRLGRFPLPVEIISFAADLTLQHLKKSRCQPSLRKENGKEFITDNNHFIADCRFLRISDPKALHLSLKAIPGVVETGLFMSDMVNSVIVGYTNGKVEVIDNR